MRSLVDVCNFPFEARKGWTWLTGAREVFGALSSAKTEVVLAICARAEANAVGDSVRGRPSGMLPGNSVGEVLKSSAAAILVTEIYLQHLTTCH